MTTFKGNQCLLWLQKLSNYALLSVSFTFLALGIYLYTTTRTFGIFQITFISLGTLELLSAIFALTKYNSKGFIACYVHIMLVLISIQALTSGLAFVYKDKIVLWAEEANSMEANIVKHFHSILVKNVDMAIYLAISASTIQVLSLVITACYKATLKKQKEKGDLYDKLLSNKKSGRNGRDKEDPYRNITDKDAKEWNESLKHYKNKNDAQYQIEVLLNSLSSFFCDLSSSISGCFGLSNNNPRDSSLRKVSHAFPAPLLRCKLIPSDKHDDKFYYINDEVEVDKTIAQLDEAANIDESQAETLELTLSNLRELRNKLAMFTLYDSADEFEPVREVADEETPSSSLIKSRQTLALTSPESHINKASPTIFDHSDSSGSKFKREIRQGTLAIEVQKGFFFHPKFLQKYNLQKPYVQIKIYHTEKAKNRTTHEYNSRGTEVAKFKTQQAPNPLHTEWDELFEYKFTQDKKMSSYSFGFTLFYTCYKGNQDFQVGEEQIFSIGSLLDQSMQTKYIDFLDQDLKGLLARLGVRFQFLHDPELVKDRLLVEVKTKIEKLLKIKERHPIFLPEKKERTHSKLHVPKLSSYSHRGSEFSMSSTHENDDHGYYLK